MEGKDWAQESTACFPHSRTIFQEHHFRDDFRQNHPADDACPLLFLHNRIQDTVLFSGTSTEDACPCRKKQVLSGCLVSRTPERQPWQPRHFRRAEKK